MLMNLISSVRSQSSITCITTNVRSTRIANQLFLLITDILLVCLPEANYLLGPTGWRQTEFMKPSINFEVYVPERISTITCYFVRSNWWDTLLNFMFQCLTSP
jgi:hypothetical protein